MAASATSCRLAGASAGIGLRLPHLAEIVATRPCVDWLEVHPENFLGNPHATELLLTLREDYPISVHTVGISIGSADGIDRTHLKRLRAWIDRLDPALVSGHLAWSSVDGAYPNDLLPLPFDEDVLSVVVEHLGQVQDALGRPYLIENPSSYVGFRHSTMTEVEFLGELVGRTGARLLCDVSNIHLSGHNMGYDPFEYVDQFPVDAVEELHLGGFSPEDDDGLPGQTLLVDTHATPVAPPAWDLYAYAPTRFGSIPTLIEWDNDIPPLPTLLSQAGRADEIAAAIERGEALHAVTA